MTFRSFGVQVLHLAYLLCLTLTVPWVILAPKDLWTLLQLSSSTMFGWSALALFLHGLLLVPLGKRRSLMSRLKTHVTNSALFVVVFFIFGAPISLVTLYFAMYVSGLLSSLVPSLDYSQKAIDDAYQRTSRQRSSFSLHWEWESLSRLEQTRLVSMLVALWLACIVVPLDWNRWWQR